MSCGVRKQGEGVKVVIQTLKHMNPESARRYSLKLRKGYGGRGEGGRNRMGVANAHC